MTRLRTLLLVTVVIALVLACFCSGAVAGAATGRPVAAGGSAEPTAVLTAHAGPAGRRHRHSSAGRQACHAARHRHKHRQRCGTRARAAHRRRLRVHPRRESGAIVTVSLPAELIASVLATPCQNTALTPEPGDLEQIRAATLCLVNQERARHSELPLALNAQLEQAAQSHSEDMVGENYFAHLSPNGETPVNRAQAAGYIPNLKDGYTIGENIAWGTLSLATPSTIVAAWIASPEHLANILYSDYRDTAIGVVPAAPPALANGEAGAIYTQEFGVVAGRT